MIDALTLDDFCDKLQQTFNVRRDSGLPPLTVTLIQAEELPARALTAGVRRRPFSMIVTSPIHWVLAQGTYAVEVPGLGTLDLFIVPVGPSADRAQMCYQILFN
jgi:hypothetical protein